MSGEHLYALQHAIRRYPDVPPRLALHFLESDRGKAGLGALAHAAHRGEVRNHKIHDLLNRHVVYSMVIDKRARLEYPREFYCAPIDEDGPQTVTLVTVPAKYVERCVRVWERDLRTQRGRDYVAALLRRARRELRS